MVLYFSGTGNSRFAAQQLARVCEDELVSINRSLRQRILDPYQAQYAFESDSPFVIVCPTYCWHIPRVVETFLKESRFLGSRRMYFVLTCGGGTGNAAEHAKQICHEISMDFCGLASVLMPENYISLFRAPEADEAVGIIRAAMPQLEGIANQILLDRSITDSYAGRAVPDFVVRGFYRFFVHDKRFHVKDNCIGCTACAKLCPLVNITMHNGRPVWNGHCTQCQGCIAVCPVDAIEFGSRTRRKRRYYLFADGRHKFPKESRPEAEAVPAEADERHKT